MFPPDQPPESIHPHLRVLGEPEPEPYDAWLGVPAHDPHPGARATPALGAERLTHLVLVDGRLVDVWSEPVEHTAWAHHAQRFDAEARRPPPRAPLTERVLDWLADLCGGDAAVAALDAEPLEPLSPLAGSAGEVGRLLTRVAEQWFDPETEVALHRALHRLLLDDPTTLERARTPAHLAGGIAWAVGRANGCLRPTGPLGVARVAEAVGLKGSLADPGRRVQRALLGFRELRSQAGPYGGPARPPGCPDLLPLGHADLLLARTRADLVRLRDRALRARDVQE